MSLEELKNKIRQYFTGKPVKRVFIFGSFLEKGADANDIVLIAEFDYEEAPRFSFLEHIALAQGLEDEVGKKIDLLSYTAIKPDFMKLIEADMQQLYERGW